MSCDSSTTLTSADLSNAKSNFETIKTVVESGLDVTTTPDGKVIDTLAGALKKLGWEVPAILYAAGVAFAAGDERKVIERSGIIYAPLPSAIPFTTSGTWTGNDENNFYPVTAGSGPSSIVTDYFFPTSAALQSLTDKNATAVSLLPGDTATTQGQGSAGDGGGSQYLIKTAAQAAADGDTIDGSKNLLLSSGDVAIRLFDHYDFQKSKLYHGENAITNSSRDAGIGLLAASITRRKPRVSALINSKIQAAMSNEFCDYVTPAEAGANNNGIVFGRHSGSTGTVVSSIVMYAVPITDISGAVTISVDTETINGSSLNDISVRWGQWNSFENGSARIGSLTSITRVGTNWSDSPTLPGTAAVGDLVGIYIVAPSQDDLYELTGVTITHDGATYTLSRLQKQNTVINLLPGSTFTSVHTQFLPNGVELRNNGIRSGYVPAKIWATPSADSNSGKTGVNADSTQTAGYYPDDGLIPNFAHLMAITYYLNGFKPPAVILESGTYVNQSSRGHIDPSINSFYTSPSEWVIACSNGTAIFQDGASSSKGVILEATNAEAVEGIVPKFYLKGITCDTSITQPFKFNNVDVDGSYLECQASDTEGFEIDYGDVSLESCIARDVTNDGFNSHESGHTSLVYCQAIDNLDDGFSPHDDCTYEVHGGSYTGSGKGNIIPAFGALGYCVGVTSSDSTGLSVRVSTDGINDGGFVCLADNLLTTMFLVDCDSTADQQGIVSSGELAYTLSVDSSVSAAINHDYASAASSPTNEAGVLVTVFEDTSGNSVLDEENRVTSYNFTALRRDFD